MLSGTRSASALPGRPNGGAAAKNLILTPEVPTSSSDRAQWFRVLQLALKQAQQDGQGKP